VGREPAIKAKELEVRNAGGTDGLIGGGNRFGKGKPHLWRPPPQHQQQRPPAHQHRTSERWPPQSAPAGPHSRPRHKNKNGTIPEHEYRPRGVRRVARSPGAANGARRTWTWPARARHDRHPSGRRAAALRPGGRRWHRKQRQSRSGWGARHAVAASATDGERPSPPITEGRSGPLPTPRRTPALCTVPSSPARMMNCWNLLSAARRPTGVNSGDNRVTCSGAIALLI
jgi:hypothetical protein